MKFIIKKYILLESLLNTSKAISSRNLIPILTGIKFDLTEEGLYLSASDSDISIRTFIDKNDIVNIEEVGSIVISGKYIVEIIKRLPDTEILIEVLDGFNMIIQTEGSEFNLNGIDPDEFPNLDLEETQNPVILNPIEFKTAINQTSFATSLAEDRPLLTGINFNLVEDKLLFLATDSYRIACKEITLNEKYSENFNIVIPGKNLLELSRIIDDEKENIYLHIFNNKLLFKYKNICFLSRLIAGNYPCSVNTIPENFKIDIVCNADILYNMIDRASLFTSDKDKKSISLTLENGELIIASNSSEIGKVKEKIEVSNDSNIAIFFCAKYMLEAIRSFNCENIHILLNKSASESFNNAAESAIVLKSDDNPELIQLITTSLS